MAKAKDELHKLMSDFPNKPLLVFANKQDLPTAMDRSRISQNLNLDELDIKNYFVLDCSAFSGYNLKKGFKKLSKMM